MDLGEDPEGATPLTEDQRQGLKLSYVTTRDELNEAEADNIALAQEKWLSRDSSLTTLLDDLTVRELHKNMLGDVWSWAGTYRSGDLNIGVEFWKVSGAVRDLVADAAYWFADGSPLTVDDAAVRFHHRIVEIHPFPNGNGRHARLLTDLVLRASGHEPFSWGRGQLGPIGELRRTYIGALQAADFGDFDELRAFVRS